MNWGIIIVWASRSWIGKEGLPPLHVYQKLDYGGLTNLTGFFKKCLKAR